MSIFFMLKLREIWQREESRKPKNLAKPAINIEGEL
jgi:hypothetical protein